MTTHYRRFWRLVLAVALLASTVGVLVDVDDTAIAAPRGRCDAQIEAGTHVLNVDGYEVLLYVPESAAKKHVPLVVNLHASGGTGAGMLDGFYDTRHVADANGFALLAPTGVAAPLFGGWQWNVPGVPLFLGLPIENDRDDVEFVEHAIDAAGDAMCLDMARVYVTGFSGGARMASQLACDLADRVAAVAPISGVRFPLASDAALGLPDSQDCDPDRNIPILAMHGTNDATNPWDAGTPGTAWSYSGEAAIDRWAEFNACQPTPRVTAMTDNIDLVEYRACHANADVKVVMINDGNHTVPSYPVPWEELPNDEIDGFEVAWDLLASYRLPGRYVAAQNAALDDSTAD
jgi:polyhydroxybutyrate depolymerase